MSFLDLVEYKKTTISLFHFKLNNWETNCNCNQVKQNVWETKLINKLNKVNVLTWGYSGNSLQCSHSAYIYKT